MAELDLLVETDFQVMSRLVAQLNRSVATVEERLAALLDLEYLVHQVRSLVTSVLFSGFQGYWSICFLLLAFPVYFLRLVFYDRQHTVTLCQI